MQKSVTKYIDFCHNCAIGICSTTFEAIVTNVFELKKCTRGTRNHRIVSLKDVYRTKNTDILMLSLAVNYGVFVPSLTIY